MSEPQRDSGEEFEYGVRWTAFSSFATFAALSFFPVHWWLLDGISVFVASAGVGLIGTILVFRLKWLRHTMEALMSINWPSF